MAISQVHWHYLQALPLHIPLIIKPWLIASGSLTKQLTLLSKKNFSVQVINEGYRTIAWHEAKLLGCPQHQVAWVREVYLYGSSEQPWVKARSVIPLITLKGQGQQLKALHNRSLGSLLFQRHQPKCTRQIAYLNHGWIRRSLYVWHDKPLIVQESFLPAFEQFLMCSAHSAHLMVP